MKIALREIDNMESQYEKEFNKVVFTNNFEVQEYESCIFNGCNFEIQILGESRFIDCRFIECNFSSCNLNHTAFRDVNFKDCKLIGLRFDMCNQFGFAINFENCVLDYSMMNEVDLRKSKFKNCSLIEVDFSFAILTKSKIYNCNLSRAKFERSEMQELDIRESIAFRIDPTKNNIQKMKISSTQLSGLLSEYNLDIG